MKKTLLLGSICIGLAACNNVNTTEDMTETNAGDTTNTKVTLEEETEPSLEQAWESDTTLITNESVLYVADQNELFVSNIQGQPTAQDGNGYIAKLSPEGEIINAQWATGLDAPKGMGIHQGKLFVTDVDELVAIDLMNPEDQQRWSVPGAVFLNDVTVGNNAVYFSDMKTGKLHRYKEGEITLLREGHANINGLEFAQGKLYALDGSGLHQLPLDGSEPMTINSQVTGGDGLVWLEDSTFLASRWQGEIWLVNGSEATKLFDSKADEVQTADIGYNPSANMVYVPRFFANKVTAMRLSY